MKPIDQLNQALYGIRQNEVLGKPLERGDCMDKILSDAAKLIEALQRVQFEALHYVQSGRGESFLIGALDEAELAHKECMITKD